MECHIRQIPRFQIAPIIAMNVIELRTFKDQRALKRGSVCLQKCFSFLRTFSETFSRTFSKTFSETFSRTVSETFSKTLLWKRSYKGTEPVPLEYTFMWNVKGAWYTPLAHVHIPLKTSTRKLVLEIKNDQLCMWCINVVWFMFWKIKVVKGVWGCVES